MSIGKVSFAAQSVRLRGAQNYNFGDTIRTKRRENRLIVLERNPGTWQSLPLEKGVRLRGSSHGAHRVLGQRVGWSV